MPLSVRVSTPACRSALTASPQEAASTAPRAQTPLATWVRRFRASGGRRWRRSRRRRCQCRSGAVPSRVARSTRGAQSTEPSENAASQRSGDSSRPTRAPSRSRRAAASGAGAGTPSTTSSWFASPSPSWFAGWCCTWRWSRGSTSWCRPRRCCWARASASRTDASPEWPSSTPPRGADLVEPPIRAGDRPSSLVAALPLALAALEQIVAVTAVAESDQLAGRTLRQVRVALDREQIPDRGRRRRPELPERRLANVADRDPERDARVDVAVRIDAAPVGRRPARPALERDVLGPARLRIELLAPRGVAEVLEQLLGVELVFLGHVTVARHGAVDARAHLAAVGVGEDAEILAELVELREPGEVRLHHGGLEVDAQAVALQALDRGHEPPERARYPGDRVVHLRVRGEDRQLDRGLREPDPVGEDAVDEAAPARVLRDVEEVGPHHDLAAREREVEPAHVGQLVEQASDLLERQLVAAHLLLASVLDDAVAMDALLVAAVGQLEVDVERRPVPVGLGADQRHERLVAEAGVLGAALEDHRLSPLRRRSMETRFASASRSMNSTASARMVASDAA